jgi:dolichol-phosphate mannosyltransferase
MHQSTQPQSISIIIPVMNEDDGITFLSEKLSRLEKLFEGRAVFEFIFVDDGSTDRTSERLQAAYSGQQNIRVLVHSRNRGVGAAFRTGFAEATGSIVCTIDADCSYEPEGLERLVDALDKTSADIAIASPYHPQGAVENILPWRIFISRVCSGIYRLISPVALYTYTSIFRAYRRSVIETVQFEADGFVCAAEILIRAAKQGYRIVEVPMTLRGRKIGTTKMKVLRTIRSHLRMMASTVFYASSPKRTNQDNIAKSSPVVGRVRSATSTIPRFSGKE